MGLKACVISYYSFFPSSFVSLRSTFSPSWEGETSEE